MLCEMTLSTIETIFDRNQGIEGGIKGQRSAPSETQPRYQMLASVSEVVTGVPTFSWYPVSGSSMSKIRIDASCNKKLGGQLCIIPQLPLAKRSGRRFVGGG